MKNYPHILSYLALSLLAACGGGGGGGSPSTASSDTNQPKIECNAECQAGRKAAEEAEKAKAEAERKAAEEAEKAKAEAERKAAEEAEKAKVETERKAAEEAEKAKVEADRKAVEEAEKAKAEAERKAAEEAEKTKVEAERKAAEKAKAEAERKAAEEAEKAKAEAERKAAEEAEKAKAEAERKAAEEAQKAKGEAERRAAEEAEKAKAEAERKAAEAAATQQIDGYYSKISQSGMEGDDISHIGDINILELDGQKIPLLPETEPQRAEVFGNVNEKSVLVAANHLKYGRYGFYGLRNENGDIHTSYMFYQGVITPEAAMPQEGQAFYRGYALYSDVGQANTFGNSIFMVDFGRKSLSGAVYSENGEFDEVNLEGQIVGNRFFHVDEKEQKIMSGMFLGPQAEELTGRFDHLLESKNGTFGAAALKE
jgi:putative lipoprotein